LKKPDVKEPVTYQINVYDDRVSAFHKTALEAETHIVEDWDYKGTMKITITNDGFEVERVK